MIYDHNNFKSIEKGKIVGGKVQLNTDIIIKLRRNLGLSQLEMAMLCKEKKLSIALSTIKRVETGKIVSLRTARNIALFFECSLDSLVTLSDKPLISINTTFTPIIGRQSELEQFDNLLSRTIRHGKLHLIYLNALPGVGKTKLIEAFISTASAQRTMVFKECVINDQSLSWFHPLVSLQKDLSRRSPSIEHAPLKLIDKDATLDEISKHCIKQLTCLNNTILLIFEDIHWAKDRLMQDFKSIIATLSNYPIIIVFTFRNEIEKTVNAWHSTLLNIPTLKINLQALSNAEAEILVEKFNCPDNDYKQKCILLSEGNPLFLTHIMNSYSNETQNIPDTLKQLIISKIDSLDIRTRDVAYCASVLGDNFELQTLENLAGNIETEINTLIHHSIFFQQSSNEFHFNHALIRQIIYNSLSESRRNQFHRLIAEWYKNRDNVTYSYHLKNSGSHLAMPAFLNAAEDFKEKHNYADALTLVDSAIELNPDDDTRFSLFIFKGILLRQLNLPEKSIDFFLQAIKLSKQQADQLLESYIELAISYYIIQRFEYAKRSIKKAKQIACEVTDDDLASRLSYMEEKLFHQQNNSLIFKNEQWQDKFKQSPELTKQLSQAYDTYTQVKQPPYNLFFEQDDDTTKTIEVGVLFSQSGDLQELEMGVIQTTLMAIDEINMSGGLLGKKIVPIMADGKSDENIFKKSAKKLLTNNKPKVIFGCSTSSSRKMVEPVIAQHKNLLMYPFQYEGMEASPHITYVGPAPNQQALPAVEWLFRKNRKQFFLIGSNYIYPLVTNKLIKDQLKQWKVTMCDEQYVPLSGIDFDDIIEEIKEKKPDAIILTLVGFASNLAFYKQFYEAGLKDLDIDIMSLVLSENDLNDIPIEYVSNYYTLFSYFQNIDDSINDDFVYRFKQRYGVSARIGGYMESAYLAVYLWAKAVLKAESFNINKVKTALKGTSHYGPGGLAYVDEENNHVWRQVRIAKVHDDGEFHVIWSSEKPIAPIPFPPTSNIKDMEKFIHELYLSWNGKWEKKPKNCRQTK